MHSDLCTQGSATRVCTHVHVPPCTLALELYETPTRYTRCAYFNDLINCRHGQYVQWLSALLPLSIFAPLSAKNHQATDAFHFFPLSFFFFLFLLYARHWKLVYWVIRGIINSVEKYEIFFFRRCYLCFPSFFFCFFFENLKS